MAHRIRTSEAAGKGCLLQATGILLPILGSIFFGLIGLGLGLIIGVATFLIGTVQARIVVCSDCRGQIHPKANVCRHCQATLGEEPLPSWLPGPVRRFLDG